MLKINIIPQYLKDEIKLRSIYVKIKNLLYFIMLCLIMYAIVLLVAKLILQMQFIKTINGTTIITKNTENNSKNIMDINKQMNAIQKIQEDAVEWTGLFQFLEQNIPDSIKFTKISVNRPSNLISISGNSATREGLIDFKNFLEKSEIFSEINFPIKNFLEKYNINFDVSANIKSYDFE